MICTCCRLLVDVEVDFGSTQMSDPRFARLRTDPRFRRLKKKQNKVVVDERFKSIFQGDFSENGDKKKGIRSAIALLSLLRFLIIFF